MLYDEVNGKFNVDECRRMGFGTVMKLSRRRFLQLAGGAAAPLVASRSSFAQNYPTRPIRLVVPFPPGGAFDAVGRPFADKVKPSLGTMVIENIGGAGSSLGASAVARAQPDGYTILLGGTQTHVNEALLKGRPLYDPVKDLAPIASVASYSLAIAVHPSVPAKTMSDLVAHAKANPGKLSYGHAGVGTIQHLTGELFKSRMEIPEIIQLPYRGTGPAISDLVGGQIPMAILGMTGQVLELHRSDKIRVLAVTGPTRLAAAPDLPTMADLGFPGMTVTGSIGLLAPAGTQVGIIEQIARAARAAVTEPSYRQMLIEAGMQDTLDSNPEKFSQSLAADVALWAPLVKALGLKID
jgi:tripartite-type tricarboxylate transporter receptor subunit TctC